MAFQDLKKYLENPEVQTNPTPGAPLLLYVEVEEGALSAVLVEERSQDGKEEQAPVYYVSQALAGPSCATSSWRRWRMSWSWPLTSSSTTSPPYPLNEVF